MFWYMFEERIFVYETFITRVAFKRFVLLMTSRMGLEIAELAECFRTAVELAPVGLVPRVGSNVLL